MEIIFIESNWFEGFTVFNYTWNGNKSRWIFSVERTKWSLILFINYSMHWKCRWNFPSFIFSHRKCSIETHWKSIANATIKANHQITWVKIVNLIDSSAIHYNNILMPILNRDRNSERDKEKKQKIIQIIQIIHQILCLVSITKHNYNSNNNTSNCFAYYVMKNIKKK